MFARSIYLFFYWKISITFYWELCLLNKSSLLTYILIHSFLKSFYIPGTFRIEWVGCKCVLSFDKNIIVIPYALKKENFDRPAPRTSFKRIIWQSGEIKSDGKSQGSEVSSTRSNKIFRTFVVKKCTTTSVVYFNTYQFQRFASFFADSLCFYITWYFTYVVAQPNWLTNSGNRSISIAIKELQLPIEFHSNFIFEFFTFNQGYVSGV